MAPGQRDASLGVGARRRAETEKYAHVTFFFNGGTEKEYALEDRKMVPSPKVPTYDKKPDMSALEVADEVRPNVRATRHRGCRAAGLTRVEFKGLA